MADTQVHARLYLGCVRYYVACVTLGHALVYCNFHKGGKFRWLGPEGPKAPSLGRHISASLLYLGCVRKAYLKSDERGAKMSLPTNLF